MIRWLDALGLMKWPNLLLVAAPVVAYPFWLPSPPPAQRCEPVSVNGQVFVPYRSVGADEVFLRPTRSQSAARPIPEIAPLRFDNGGMVVSGTPLERAGVKCHLEEPSPN